MIFILLLSVEMKELYSRVCMCICVSQMLHAATFDLQNSSMSQCSTQTLLSCGKCLQVATKPIRLDNKLVQWVCAGFCEVIWLSEMQLGSILQWTSVLVSLLVSGSFPASALILLVVNLMSTTLSFPSLFFSLLLLLNVLQCSLFHIPPFFFYLNLFLSLLQMHC